MASWTTGRRIAVATLIAGTLDILAAISFTIYFGRDVLKMLRGVASGPIPPAVDWGVAGSVTGLAVHFALMAIMAAVFVLAADRWDALKRRPILWGVVYGLVTYVVMNLLVVPIRFSAPLPHEFGAIARQLFCHVVLVGIPIALVARKG